VTSPGAAIDVDTDTVEVGFLGLASSDVLTSIVWTAAEWSVVGTTTYAKILVGAGTAPAPDPAAVRLAVGIWRAYVRIVAGSETIPLLVAQGVVKVLSA